MYKEDERSIQSYSGAFAEYVPLMGPLKIPISSLPFSLSYLSVSPSLASVLHSLNLAVTFVRSGCEASNHRG